MPCKDYTILFHGESGLTLQFTSPSSTQLSTYIQQMATFIRRQWSVAELEVIPAYQSLTLHQEQYDCATLAHKLEILLEHFSPEPDYIGQTIEIPVCYEPEFAPDMPFLSEYTGLPPKEIIERHSRVEYLVHMLGFLPGFLYLGDLDPHLACPRKSTPDMRLVAGSVAIGGNQTGVYPLDSPGGWHVIGRTPSCLFQPGQQQAFIARPLDIIRFKPITSLEFYSWPGSCNEH